MRFYFLSLSVIRASPFENHFLLFFFKYGTINFICDLGLNLYFWLVVYSHWHEIKLEYDTLE